MSLYNMIHGVNQATFFILPALGKHAEEYPRFRDCFYGDKDRPEYADHIIVYTRTGGGNREAYEDANDELTEMPTYVADYDDDFDCTFANFVFAVPEEWKADITAIAEGRPLEISDAYFARLCEVYPKLKEKFEEMFGRKLPE